MVVVWLSVRSPFRVPHPSVWSWSRAICQITPSSTSSILCGRGLELSVRSPFEYLIHLYGRGLSYLLGHLLRVPHPAVWTWSEVSARSPLRVPHPSVWTWSELSVRSPLRVPHPSVWTWSELSVRSPNFEYLIHLYGRGLSYLLGHPFEYLIHLYWTWSELSARSPLRVPRSILYGCGLMLSVRSLCPSSTSSICMDVVWAIC